MKIVNQEVKTIVTITLDLGDFERMIEEYKKSDFYRACYHDAFKGMSVTAIMNEENLIKVMKEMHGKGNKDTYQYIAKVNGFDGWENAGFHNETNHTYRMTVYSYGDTLNN